MYDWKQGFIAAGEGRERAACRTPALGRGAGVVCWAGMFNSILCLPLFRQCKLSVCLRIPSLFQQMFYLCNWWSN